MNHKPDPFPALDEASTPAAMRAVIERAANSSPIVRNVLMLADINGMNAEDRYTALAYHALQALFATQRSVYGILSKMPPAQLIVTAEKECERTQ